MATSFSYAYSVTFNSVTNTYTVNNSIDLTDAAAGPGTNDLITDDQLSTGDNPLILGDVTPDVFSWQFSNGPLQGTATYVGLASNTANSSEGFVGRIGSSYYYLTNNQLTNVSGSNSLLTVTIQEDIICFMPGTMIRTPEGERPVESLKYGDLVTTTDGRAISVRWIGRQTVSTTFADPLRVNPIRIKANALGESVPARDLLVSPDHAILHDGVLVHAGALVNGTSIVRESNVPEVFTYYHVEVDDHSLILAENVPAETFIDNVDRLAFDNWDEHVRLYPEGKAIVEMPYPRAKAYRQIPQATREKLATRGIALYGADVSSAA
jgi:Hint domain-containing protein